MDTTLNLKNTVLEYVNSADNRLLEMIKALAESYTEPGNEFDDDENKRIIERRLERIENGTAKFYSVDELKQALKE